MKREIVLLNGNTTAAVTDRMLAAAPTLPDIALRGLTAPFGAPYVSDRAAFAVAGHAIVEMARGLAADPPGAAVVACFGDPGLWAAREILPCPVVGMAEASMHAAAQLAPRLGILTGGKAWGPMLRALAQMTGLAGRLAHVEPLTLTGDAIAADPDRAMPALRAGVARLAEQGADVVILGGAALTGFAPLLRDGAPVPILDGLTAAVTQAYAMMEVCRQ
jgi:Asp/Glu/hydantoin racemase